MGKLAGSSLLFIFMLSITGVYAQDLLLLNNGKEIPCLLLRKDSFEVSYTALGRPKNIEKSLVREIRTDRLILKDGKEMQVIPDIDLFSTTGPMVTYREIKNNKDISIYKIFHLRKRTIVPFGPYEDSIRVTTDETVIYRQDTMTRRYDLAPVEMRSWVMGRRSARKHFRSPLSTLGGAAVGFAGGVTLHYFFSFLPATVYTAVNGSVRPKVTETGPEDVPYLEDPLFIDGYRTQATKLKLKNSLIGAASGIVGGLLINYFLVPN